MGVPETGTGNAGGGGNWVTIQPGIPPEFLAPIEVIQALLDALLIVLNIALAILQVVKAFLVGFLDPLAAIIQLIIDEILDFLTDLRQLGLYISGDTRLTPDFEDILGGFQAYERRMIGRLTDRSDPTRPDFTGASACIAIFTYTSVDVSSVQQLINVINKLLGFFGQTVPVRAYTTPTALRVSYGLDGASLYTFGPLTKALQEGTPDTANLRWQMAPPPSGTQVRFPSMAPKGFLLEISTVPDGLLVAYDVPVQNMQLGADLQRSYGLMRDPKSGLPFRLYGGAYMMDVGDLADPTFEEGTSADKRLYAYKSAADDVPIPIDVLVTDDNPPKFLLQRTFFVSPTSGILNLTGPGQGFAATVRAADMPYKADFEVDGDGKVVPIEESVELADTVYVRVSAVTEEVTESVAYEGQSQDAVQGALTASLKFWSISSGTLQAQIQEKGFATFSTGTFAPGDKTEASFPLTVTFPGAQTNAYIEAVTVALAVMALSRSDLSSTDDNTTFYGGVAYTSTGLENLGSILMPMLLGNYIRDYFKKYAYPPTTFRKKLLLKCRALANHLYSKSGSLGDLEATVVSLAEPMMSFKWSDAGGDLPEMTILETLQSDDKTEGIGLNPYSMGVSGAVNTRETLKATYFSREPGFLEKPWNSSASQFFDPGQGSADLSPVIYADGWGTIAFCRNALYTNDVYSAAAAVLNVAAAPATLPTKPGEGGWIAIRLFPQGLWPLEAVLQQIIAFVRSIGEGLSAVTDVILAYIDFLEGRILELQALVVRLNGLLEFLQGFNLPPVSALVVSGSGTAGILGGLVNAGDKPQDSVTSYGGGLVFFAGGLPSLLIELLQAIFGGGSE